MAVDFQPCEMFPKRLTLLRKRPRTSSLLAIDSSTQNASKRPRPRGLISATLVETRTGSSMTIRPPPRFAILMKAVSPPPRSLRKEAILNSLRLQGWAIPVSPLSLDGSSKGSKSIFFNKTEEPDEKFPNEKIISRPNAAPSPLGLSNYDELDDWNGYDDEFEGTKDFDFDSDTQGQVYSNFNFLDSDSSSSNDPYDDPFSVLPTELTPPTTPTECQPSICSSKITTCSPNWCSSPVSCQVCG